MNSKIKKGLGRGLSSLIGETRIENKTNKLSLSDIIPNKYQPRKNFEEENLEDVIETHKNKDLRKLYRKIASATHPDKTGDEDLSKVFDQAARAYEKDDLAALLDIAGNLNIEIIELSPESLVLLKNNIDLLSKEINTLKENTSWYWANAKDEEEKNKILEFVYNFRNGDKKWYPSILTLTQMILKMF